jgi:hypothetical protein
MELNGIIFMRNEIINFNDLEWKRVFIFMAEADPLQIYT